MRVGGDESFKGLQGRLMINGDVLSQLGVLLVAGDLTSHANVEQDKWQEVLSLVSGHNTIKGQTRNQLELVPIYS